MFYIKAQNSNTITAVDGILYIYDGEKYKNIYKLQHEDSLTLTHLGTYGSRERAEQVFGEICEAMKSGKKFFAMPEEVQMTGVRRRK